ncbi:MAG TPA: pentapeptide repeat-containing protein [Streptosporangiaceae bacterium]
MSAQAPSAHVGTTSPSRRREFFKALGIVGVFLAGLAGLVGTSGTLFLSWQSARTAEQGLVTERFKNGVDELGSSDENVQAGGMFTLARVARDSPGDAGTAYGVVLSFVRGHLCRNMVPKLAAFSGPPQSVTAGLQVLHQAGRHIDLTRLKCDIFPADLTGVDLHGADLGHAELPGASLESANLKGANLNNANLDSTDFTHHAVLTGADFSGADISSAGFRGSVGLTRDQLRRARWSHPPRVDPGEKGWITH